MRGYIRCDAGVHNGDTCAHLPRQHVDRSAAAQEIQHHRSGDALWVGADALRDNAMVSSANDDGPARWQPVDAPDHAGDLHG